MAEELLLNRDKDKSLIVPEICSGTDVSGKSIPLITTHIHTQSLPAIFCSASAACFAAQSEATGGYAADGFRRNMRPGTGFLDDLFDNPDPPDNVVFVAYVAVPFAAVAIQKLLPSKE
jgi:hypothetical protein